MSANYPEYDGHLENRSGRSTAQPTGVTGNPSNDGWGHKEEMETVENEKRKSISQRVNEGRDGPVASPYREDHGKEGHKASTENDDKLVDEEKSLKEKYADRYGN